MDLLEDPFLLQSLDILQKIISFFFKRQSPQLDCGILNTIHCSYMN